MKFRKSLISAFASGALLFGGTLLAQDTPPPPTPAAPLPPPPAPTAPLPSPDTAHMQTPKGEVVINSMPAKAPVIGQPPSFEQLSGGHKSISESQAEAFPPLANDFSNADSNRDGHVNKAEYQRWLKQL